MNFQAIPDEWYDIYFILKDFWAPDDPDTKSLPKRSLSSIFLFSFQLVLGH